MSDNGKSDNASGLKPGWNVYTSADLLRSFVNRIEWLAADKAAIGEDIKTVYIEAKNEGFDTKILRQVITRRAKGADVSSEQDQLIEAYEAALGGQQLVLPIEIEQREAAA